MRSLVKALAVLAILTLPVTTAWAEMPNELKGSWILDAPATEEHLKTSPQWKAEDAKFLPTILKRMSQFLFGFEEDAIVSTMRGRQQVIPVELKEKSGHTYVFEGKVRDQTITLTVSFVDDRTISIRSSASDDMDYFLWKRGQLAEEAGPSDASLATEILEKATKTPSNQAGDGKSD